MTYVSGIIVSPNARNLAVGYQCTLSTRIAPKAATNQTIIWRSEDSTVASVDPTTGVITGKKPGTVKIYACATDGSGVEGKATITVEHPIHVTSVEVFPNTVIEAKPGEKIYHIYANVLPLNATMPDLIWSSSNEEIATVQSNGIVTIHKDGVVQITATSVEGNLSDSCTINVDSREKVTIEKDGDFNKVVFENGKVWYCINEDMCYDQDKAFDEILEPRMDLNFLSDPNDPMSEPRTYTNEELSFLYSIDPHGVARYVQIYAYVSAGTADDSLERILSYKDSIFELLFGRKPRYYARTISGQWYETEDKNDLKKVMSESETIFGAHTIYDATTWLALGGFAVDVIGTVFGTNFFNTGGFIKKGIAKVVKTFVRILTIGEAIVKNEISSYVLGTGIDKAFEETSMDWLSSAVSIYDRLEQLSQAIVDKPGVYLDLIHYYVSNDNYRVFIKLKTDEIVEIKSLEEAILSLQ